MKKLLLTFIVVVICTVCKSQQQNNPSTANVVPEPPAIITKDGKPVGYNDDQSISLLAEKYKSIKHKNIDQNDQEIINDFSAWWTYTYSNIKLSQDFIGIAPDSQVLSKKVFLQLLTTGMFYPVKTYTKNNIPVYSLYSLNTANSDIQKTTIQLASDELFYYNMEGKKLPVYHFEDLAGHKYNNENTRGKIVVLKCWFIHCTACVKEFPALNKLVDDYKNRKDILFISLAFDNKQDLITFLNTKKFNYAVVPNQQEFLDNQLGITTYPTHIVVGKDGKVVKVVDNYNDLVPALKKEASKK